MKNSFEKIARHKSASLKCSTSDLRQQGIEQNKRIEELEKQTKH